MTNYLKCDPQKHGTLLLSAYFFMGYFHKISYIMKKNNFFLFTAHTD